MNAVIKANTKLVIPAIINFMDNEILCTRTLRPMGELNVHTSFVLKRIKYKDVLFEDTRKFYSYTSKVPK